MPRENFASLGLPTSGHLVVVFCFSAALPFRQDRRRPVASYQATPVSWDLASMRSLGVRAGDVACSCGRRAIVGMSGLPDSVPVPALKRRLLSSGCGSRPEDVWPDWSQDMVSGMGRVGG